MTINSKIPKKSNKNQIRRSKDDVAIDIAIYIILGLAGLVVAYPLWFVIIASFSNPDAVWTGRVLFLPVDFTLAGYEQIFANQAIWRGYANTIFYTFFGTVINLFFTLTIAYPLSRKKFSGRNIITIFLMITMYFGGGLIPTFMLMNNLGLVNTRAIMMLMGAVSVFNIIISRVFFETNLAGDLEEAAAIDGCTPIKFFISCAIPLSKALIAVMALFYGVRHWNDFFTALIYLRDANMFPLAMILRSILIQAEVGAAVMDDHLELMARVRLAEQIRYGVIIVSSVPMLMIFPFLQRYFNKGVLIGSIKG